MASKDELAIAIDLGGTRMRVAVVDRAGALLQRDAEPTLAHLGRDQAMTRLTEAIARLIPYTEGRELVGIGMSLAGPVDPDTGVVYSPPNLPGWDGFSPIPVLEEAFRVPAWAVNDATLAAVGEHVYGIGQGTENLVYVTVSTGIGGGIIVDGKPLLGSEGFAGEVGHMSIDRNGPLCTCGNVGCLESLASGTAIARLASERLERDKGSLLAEMAEGDPARVNSRAVLEAAALRDPLAREVVEQFASDLGLGLSNLLHIFNPEIVILGGGVSQSLHLFFPLLKAAVRRHAMAHIKDRIPLVASILGDDAALLGAAHLAFQRGGHG